MADTVALRLSAMELPDAGGGNVRLGDLWTDAPAAIVFLRHYG